MRGRRGKGAAQLSASCVHLFLTALSISGSAVAAAWRGEIPGGGRRWRAAQVWLRVAAGWRVGGLVGWAPAASLKVFAKNLESVCFGPERHTRTRLLAPFVASTYYFFFFALVVYLFMCSCGFFFFSLNGYTRRKFIKRRHMDEAFGSI